MGLLVEGKWVDKWYDTAANQGRFVRSQAQFRNWITADGQPGPTGSGGFQAAADRYHLYVSLACPWAHRTLIFRALKGLESMISVSVVNPLMLEHGWTFQPDAGVVADPIQQATYLHQIYTTAAADYTGRVTVPVLWDKQQNCPVSNESADIIRMFNSAFDNVGAKQGDYYPAELRQQIDALNTDIYDTINNGVYKAGFATSTAAYEQAFWPLFDLMDRLDVSLSQQRYLTGATITEADWRLFTTLIRFDAVYYGHFKCNLKRLIDYPNLYAYVRELYQWPGIATTVNFQHIKDHYYRSHTMINPTGIVPLGPELNFTAPPEREHL